MANGAFITIEGGEGVGKTSSLGAIEAFLAKRGIPITVTREPGGTALGEIVRSWILDGDHGELSAEVETLLMFAARAEHLDKVIRPAIEQGTWVVCDRFSDATMAYQGGGRGADPVLLTVLAEQVQRGLVPDLTILLDAPVAVAMARIADRPHDHFEREAGTFFERVRKTYLDLAAAEPDRIKVVDASASQSEVSDSIERELARFCERFEAAREQPA
jgi:dTMP kinase